MTKTGNFKWVINDIYSTLVLKVMHKKSDDFYGVFNVKDILNVMGEELEIETANIDDLTNFLTLSLVRFVNVVDSSDIIEIPFRNLYILYKNASVLGESSCGKLIPFRELDTFSIIDGTSKDDYLVLSAIIAKIPADLGEVMKIAYEFGDYGMQEKFDAMTRVTVINHRRLMSDSKNKVLR